MNAAGRLVEVRAEGERALKNLLDVMTFVETHKPSAELRVVLLNNVIVATVSTIEETIRQLFIEYLTIIEERIDSHEKLRSALRQANAEKYAERIRALIKERNEREAASAVDRLRICLSGGAGYQLEKLAIADNRGNFRSKQVTEIAKQIGLTELWDKISDAPEVEQYIGLPAGAACAGRLIQAWNEVFDERDLVVHRVSRANGWGAEKIRQTVALFLLVLDRITACITNDLLSLLPEESDLASPVQPRIESDYESDVSQRTYPLRVGQIGNRRGD